MLQYAVDAWCHKSIGESYWTHGVDECLLWDGGRWSLWPKVQDILSIVQTGHVGTDVTFTFDY